MLYEKEHGYSHRLPKERKKKTTVSNQVINNNYKGVINNDNSATNDNKSETTNDTEKMVEDVEEIPTYTPSKLIINIDI